MAHEYAIIMTGGAGTRFWPLSRRARPKQLLPLGDGQESLLRATFRRIGGLVPPDRTYAVTSAALADVISDELPELPRDNILAEPVGRNTAPCVGWGAAHVRRQDPDGVVMVLPADHYVREEHAFERTVARGMRQAAEGDLVTIGVRPTRAETGYGYIELGEPLDDDVHRARRFVEKPNRQRAEQFLAAGHFLWNSGMFFFRADVILDAIRTHLPGLGDALRTFDEAATNGHEGEAVERLYTELPDVSLDHGIMEKAEQVAVVPADFGWSDLGSWTTAWDLAEKDGHDNVIAEDDSVVIDTEGSYVRAPAGKCVALIGVEDLVVVDTEDALLIVPRHRTQDVRRVVQALEERNDDDHL